MLSTLLNGMDTALLALDARGTVTHWNRQAQRILGWTPEEVIGRRGLAGWAVREADAPEIEARLYRAMEAPGRQVQEFALLTKEGRRVLVRTQCSAVRGAGEEAAGLYCAFGEVHQQIDLERSVALSDALFDDAYWGVVLVDADLRPAAANGYASRALRVPRTALLGRPIGELLEQGREALEGALTHVLAEGTPPAPTETWVTLRRPLAEGETELSARRCWRSDFLRLVSPLHTEEPAPLGVAWLFQDVTDAKHAEQQSAKLRFRGRQLHRASRVAAECAEPMEAAAVHLDFALAGFADHALLDLVVDPPAPGTVRRSEQGHGIATGESGPTPRLCRAVTAPSLDSVEPAAPGLDGFLPLSYEPHHPAVQACQRGETVRAGVGDSPAPPGWAEERDWPEGTQHAVSAVLRSRGRTLGVVTFLRGASRQGFDRLDAGYAEEIAGRLGLAVDLGRALR
ncbi:PAS domain-containing protein [Streptomyces sp. NPDC005438]|uniref:PAS domain-containing protein n=1 Tax=Streptomyces sp. NPDC005438 TaxID=3156880 RepID=UPI0033AF3A73